MAVDGRVCVGLDEARLDAVAMRDDVVKVSLRDVATLVARGGIGATTGGGVGRGGCGGQGAWRDLRP
mgnify:CR=1 FL=1